MHGLMPCYGLIYTQRIVNLAALLTSAHFTLDLFLYHVWIFLDRRKLIICIECTSRSIDSVCVAKMTPITVTAKRDRASWIGDADRDRTSINLTWHHQDFELIKSHALLYLQLTFDNQWEIRRICLLYSFIMGGKMNAVIRWLCWRQRRRWW